MVKFTIRPRYHFDQTVREGSLCPCGTVGCLCDVHVTTPTPMWGGGGVWDQMALDELGDDTVNGRNVYEFFQIVLGAHHLDNLGFCQNSDGTDGPKVWRDLDDGVRAAMWAHMQTGTVWELARIELGSNSLPVTDADMVVLEKWWKQRRHATLWHDRNKRPERSQLSGREGVCVVCGVRIVRSVRGNPRVTCSGTCRNKRSRILRESVDMSKMEVTI